MPKSSAEGYSCYKLKVDDVLWKKIRWNKDLTNRLCKGYCKDAASNYAYSGTVHTQCYCRETEPLAIQKVDDDKCTYTCPGDNGDICGDVDNGYRITVSKIDSAERYSCYKFDTLWGTPHRILNLTNGLCERNCNDAYSGTYRPYCYCRKTEPSAYYKVDDDECAIECPDRTTVTMTEKNTQGTSKPSVSTRVSAMTEFMNMITSDTSSAIATKSTHYTTQDLSSTTSQNANNDISSVIIETSTPGTTGIAYGYAK
ncbi:uncharacterized protein LOC134718142 [Mytilus trossulus]|uniref:uncharacterized protein LOC134718142 n=1 Tax=Mytilus trossulus TaxID=6551 RepID=UPI0030064E08